MIIIDFVIRESSFSRSDNQSISIVSAGTIEETYFLIPIRLTVNGVELLGGTSSSDKASSSPWLEIPLLGFAKTGEEIVKEACSGKPVRFYLPDTGAFLDFSPGATGSVQIWSSINHSASCIECDELLKEFSFFVRRVKKVLADNIPDLINHPILGGWINNQ